jgi:hypothetical protein
MRLGTGALAVIAGFAAILALSGCTQAPSGGYGYEPPLQGWNGGNSSMTRPSRMLAVDQDEWEAMWRLIGLPPPRELRTGEELATAVFLGPHQGEALRVLIEGLRQDGSSLEIVYRAQSPRGDNASGSGFATWTSPWSVAVFRRRGSEPAVLRLGS